MWIILKKIVVDGLEVLTTRVLTTHFQIRPKTTTGDTNKIKPTQNIL